MEKQVFGALVGLLIFTPSGALAGWLACPWIVRSRHSYYRVLQSSMVAYLVGYGLSWILQSNFGEHSLKFYAWIQVLTSWLVLAGSHAYFVTGDDGEMVSVWRTMLLALLQIATGFLVMYLIAITLGTLLS